MEWQKELSFDKVTVDGFSRQKLSVVHLGESFVSRILDCATQGCFEKGNGRALHFQFDSVDVRFARIESLDGVVAGNPVNSVFDRRVKIGCSQGRLSGRCLDESSDFKPDRCLVLERRVGKYAAINSVKLHQLWLPKVPSDRSVSADE